MENENVIASLSKRAGGEIYLGVVGAVRTGKSTFIKRFIEGLVVPNITDEYEKKKCLDEVPQSAQGKQVMTTEPKFVPSSGAKIKVDEFETKELAKKMGEEYNVPIICSSVDTVSKDELNNMLRTALYEFPVMDINVNIPKWIDIIPMENEIKMHYLEKIKEAIYKVNKLKDVDTINNVFLESEYISKSYISNFDTSTGNVTITLESSDELYEKVLKESIGNKEITKSSLLNMFISYNENESELKNIKSAIKMAKNTGYGIMHPTIKDMKLSTPEIIKQGSRFGVKLKAQASSVHLIRVDVESTFEPIIGSEMQSKELIDYIMKDYETDKNSIWKSEIFGRSLEQIVKEGIEAKLAMMPETARFKLANTVTKIVNKGANNLIAIVI